MGIWGFDYNFTTYNFRKTLDVCLNIYCQMGELQIILNFKGLFEIMVGETIAKFRYKPYKSVFWDHTGHSHHHLPTCKLSHSNCLKTVTTQCMSTSD